MLQRQICIFGQGTCPVPLPNLQKVACTEAMRRCQQGGMSCLLSAVARLRGPGLKKTWRHNFSFTLTAVPPRARLRQVERVCLEQITPCLLYGYIGKLSLQRCSSPLRALPTASWHPSNPAPLPTAVHACVVFEIEKREDKDYRFKIRQIFDSRLSYSLLVQVRHFPSSSV